jgi:antitoxin ParD1/3/4
MDESYSLIRDSVSKNTRCRTVTMAPVEKITIALTKDLAADIRAAVDAGDYASTSEHVRRMWQAGIEGGHAGPLNFEEIKREAHARKAGGKPTQ